MDTYRAGQPSPNASAHHSSAPIRASVAAASREPIPVTFNNVQCHLEGWGGAGMHRFETLQDLKITALELRSNSHTRTSYRVLNHLIVNLLK